MLDNIEDVNRLDASDMIGSAQNAWQQLVHKFQVPLETLISEDISNVVYMGMGGSALAAVIFEAWQRDKLKKPFSYFREYNLPGWVDESTLVIVSSYSGNTEETLNALMEAKEKKAKIVAFANSGQAKKIAQEDGLIYFEIPSAVQPRMSVFFMLRALCEVAEKIGLSKENLKSQLIQASRELQNTTLGWRKDVLVEHNLAKQLAERAYQKNIVIMGGPLMSAAAYKWKISFNESSKNTAFFSVWPEFNHNEFIGWSNMPNEKPFAVFQLRSAHESVRIDQRYEISNRLLIDKMPEPIIIDAYGQTAIEQLLWTIILGDHTSTYLAVLNKVNPEPVDLVEDLKKELAEV